MNHHGWSPKASFSAPSRIPSPSRKKVERVSHASGSRRRVPYLHSDNLSIVMPAPSIGPQHPPAWNIRSPAARTSETAAQGGAPSNSLSGRVRAESPRGPRAPPLLQRLGAIFKSFLRYCRPAFAEGGRLHAARWESVPSRQEADGSFARSIAQTCKVMKSAGAAPEDIRAALLDAGHAANRLQRVSGGLQAVLDSLRDALRSMSEQDLTQVAKALRGPQVAQAQEQLRGPDHPHPEAEKLLVQIETAINRELIGRLETPVQKAISAALADIGDKAPSERIADQFHHAFDSAVPLAKRGALHLNEKCQLEVDRLVMRRPRCPASAGSKGDPQARALGGSRQAECGFRGSQRAAAGSRAAGRDNARDGAV